MNDNPGNEHLATYLRDHLGGASFGVELAQRVAQSNAGTEFGEPLSRIAAEIEADREELVSLMEALDVQRDVVKESIAWAGEKVGRLKLNNRLLGYSPLSRLEELEALMLGVSGKLALWRLLIEIREQYFPLAAADLPALAERAETQRALLDDLRMKAGGAAFALARTEAAVS
jgi:hypothetical protein